MPDPAEIRAINNLSPKRSSSAQNGKPDKKVQNGKSNPSQMDVKNGDVIIAPGSLENEVLDPSLVLEEPIGWRAKMQLTLVYFQIFKYAKCWDFLFLAVGLLAAIINGAAMPGMVVLFGDLIQEMIVPYSPGTGESNDLVNVTQGVSDISMDGMFLAMENQIADICAQISILGGVVFFFSYFQIAFVTLAGENILYRIRKRSFKAVLRQDIGWFDYQQTGKLVTRLADDMEKIRQGVSDKISICVQHAATFTVSFILAFYYGPRMAAILCTTIPFLVIAAAGFAMFQGTSSSDEQKQYGEAGAIADYTFSCIRTVVAFGGENREIKNYNSKLKKARKIDLRKAILGGVFLGWVNAFMFLSQGLAFWYGPKEVKKGDMSLSNVLTVFFSVMIGAMSLGQAGPIFGIISSVSGSYRFIRSILMRTPPIDTADENGVVIENLKGHIRYSDVAFSYPTRPTIKVLKNFTMDIKPGQTVALVGSSGSGKSTIVNILQRFYSIAEGKVTIDGVELDQFNLKWLRDQIGIVSQEPILFGCSIRENIEYGRDDVTAEEIERAIDEANAREFISKLPQGLDTLVGDRGSQLSGGQKQRVAIARALVRNPKILLLDEATSALDSNSERIVQEALDKAQTGRTTVVVAHRLSTIKDADQIMVLRNGETVESGTHRDLISKNGVYAEMTRIQSFNNKSDDDSIEEENKLKAPTQSSNGESSLTSNGHQEENDKSDTAKESEGSKKETLPGFLDIMKLNKPEVGFIIIACIFALISASAMPLFAIFFAELMEVFSLPPDEMQDEANFWSLMFVCLGLTIGISMLIDSWALGESGSRLTERLRAQSFKAMIRQDMSYFDDERNYVGVLTTRLAKETSLVQGATGVRLKSSLEAVCGMAVGLFIAFYFGWPLALLLLGITPLIGIAGGMQVKFATGFQVNDSDGAQSGGKVTTEAISNIRTVQGLGLEKRLFNKFHSSLINSHKSNMKTAHIYGWAQSFSQSMFFFAYASVFRFSAWLIKKEMIEPTDSLRVTFALMFAAMGMGQATSFLPDFAKAQVATKALLNLFNLASKIDNLLPNGYQIWTSKAETTDAGTVHIEFKDVHFRYPSRPDAKVMSGFSLKVMKGKTVAFVGPSGCGKSTVMQLIQRFYDPEQGEIQIDGHDLKTLSVREMRRQMAIVSQEPSLFNASIAENIRYGALKDDGEYDLTVTEDDLMRAARDANLVEFVPKLPEGYNTNVGEKGTQISGGQKQRIAIARALIRNPSILILDEATSALDSESEKVVQQALDVARQGRTCLMIAHRLTTVQNADEIVVMEHGGHIVQRGTHEQLLKDTEGLYFKLCQAQSLTAQN